MPNDKVNVVNSLGKGSRKGSLLVAGLNGCATKGEKKIYVRKKVPIGGGGLKASVAGPLRKELVLRLS